MMRSDENAEPINEVALEKAKILNDHNPALLFDNDGRL